MVVNRPKVRTPAPDGGSLLPSLTAFLMAGAEGLEPSTYGFGVQIKLY